jgi:hypothetical protein
MLFTERSIPGGKLMLSRSSLVRWSGPLSILGSLLLLTCGLLQAFVGKLVQAQIKLYSILNVPLYVIFSLLFGVALALLAIGLMALYERLTQPGKWAKWGLILAHVLVILAVAYILINVVVALGVEALLGLSRLVLLLAVFSLGVGLVVLGSITARGEGRRWKTLPLIVGLSGFLIFFASETLDLILLLLYCIGWILLGYVLWTERGGTRWA